ncbi:outer membrane lipoprotein-sorting protein [Haloferula sargassicola]
MKSLAPIMTAIALVAPAFSQNAEQLMDRARISATLQNADLQGEIDGPKGDTDVSLFLRGKDIQIALGNGQQRFHMRLGDDQYDLFEIINNKTMRFPDSKLQQPLAGSDLTYEDLAFRFLYWPNPKLEGSERVGTRDCWKIRVDNPGRKGAYALAYVWVDKEYGAFMKVEGFDRSGRRIKRFQVSDVMKIGDGKWTLQKMKVSTMNGDRAVSNSNLKFDKPKPGGTR